MNDIESNGQKLDAAHARTKAIWLELRAMFAAQDVRAECEQQLRAQENAHEDALRRELETLQDVIRTQHNNEHVNPLAGVENEP